MPPDVVILPMREREGRVPLVAEVRGTLIASSLRAVREREALNEYLARLPKELHAAVLQTVAGEWVPVRLAMAHYEAMESLKLSVLDQHAIGRDAALRIHGGLLGTLVRLATNAGVTPWVGLEQFQRLWDRILRGGSAVVFKVGEKEARIECHGVPMAKYAYFRNGWRGMIAASCEMFSKKAYAQELTAYGAPTVVAYRLAWA